MSKQKTNPEEEALKLLAEKELLINSAELPGTLKVPPDEYQIEAAKRQKLKYSAFGSVWLLGSTIKAVTFGKHPAATNCCGK
jgi:hypothetical protein